MWAAICMLVLGHSDIWAGPDEKGEGCEPQCLSEGTGLQTSDRKQIYSVSGPVISLSSDLTNWGTWLRSWMNGRQATIWSQRRKVCS